MTFSLRQLSWIMTHRGREDDAVLVEGKRLIIDAMKAGLHPSIFLFSRLNLLSGYPFDLSRDLAMYQIPYRNIKAWSELKSHPGVMGKIKVTFSYLLANMGAEHVC